MSDITKKAELVTDGVENPDNLRNGIDRNNHTYGEGENGAYLPLGKPVTYVFEDAAELKNIHLALDSDLDRKTIPGRLGAKNGIQCVQISYPKARP